ncbi:D-tagatose-bisphosphate aldolase, class II, non-catalytic subunit [Vibrio sp. JC009]|uniref:D-tagatose-bisphosphate aldolase, class II, non-catalytic subunit n=1 Tax=Vibrio sp. JC009 TaxID=2912314 RepID=UPI0023B088B9|nr:D-tagatose-bisphosphate aldolase, class II, non-catalytic subunit [Vibrio sp. JC009]WED24951.1 D-tagatose-bisphosphate aldolase, class II, non-catalytic subunit [Vibrio sp. JC009]
MKALTNLIKQHKQGQQVGIYSVCSANPFVLAAGMQQAKKDGQLLLIESTSNQVNQDGGYTGMTPADFVDYVQTLSEENGLNRGQILLGGDHLGPNCWQDLNAEEAMLKSEVLIHDYVSAGFRKIHLDCSMSCADDPVPLSDEVVANRAARLCQIAERAWETCGGEAPVYIVGTEVPVPGGAQESLDEGIEVTSPNAAQQTIRAHKDAFAQHDLESTWERVIGLVVQPGVEFDHHNVIHYQPEKAKPLSEMIEAYPNMVFEAHSTDYQVAESYLALVRDHFAILKVGPALTFALREALYALDAIEQEWLGSLNASHLRSTLDQVMHQNRDYWHSYYKETGHQQFLDCSYSLSDRIRYYWPFPEVEEACNKLISNLTERPAPVTLISQYMTNQARAVMEGTLANNPKELIIHKVMEVTQLYARACFPDKQLSLENQL